MKDDQLISIIMPAYNAEQFIAESIESVLHQTCQNWELIIIDDGSTDHTSQIIKRYALTDERIQCFYQQNGKQGKARNFGISKAKGELIAFLDADDLWVPEKLEKQIELIESSNADLVFSDVTVVNANGKKIRDSWHVEKERFTGKEKLLSFLTKNRIPLLTVMVKKKALLEINGFKESHDAQYGEDYDLWIRMLQNNCIFESVSDKWGAYRVHGAQVTSNKRAMIQIIEMLQSIEVLQGKMQRQKNKAIIIWLRRWLHSNRDVKRSEIYNTISIYPYRSKRIFLSLLFPLVNTRFFTALVDTVCAFDLKLQSDVN